MASGMRRERRVFRCGPTSASSQTNECEDGRRVRRERMLRLMVGGMHVSLDRVFAGGASALSNGFARRTPARGPAPGVRRASRCLDVWRAWALLRRRSVRSRSARRRRRACRAGRSVGRHGGAHARVVGGSSVMRGPMRARRFGWRTSPIVSAVARPMSDRSDCDGRARAGHAQSAGSGMIPRCAAIPSVRSPRMVMGVRRGGGRVRMMRSVPSSPTASSACLRAAAATTGGIQTVADRGIGGKRARGEGSALRRRRQVAPIGGGVRRRTASSGHAAIGGVPSPRSIRQSGGRSKRDVGVRRTSRAHVGARDGLQRNPPVLTDRVQEVRCRCARAAARVQRGAAGRSSHVRPRRHPLRGAGRRAMGRLGSSGGAERGGCRAGWRFRPSASMRSNRRCAVHAWRAASPAATNRGIAFVFHAGPCRRPCIDAIQGRSGVADDGAAQVVGGRARGAPMPCGAPQGSRVSDSAHPQHGARASGGGERRANRTERGRSLIGRAVAACGAFNAPPAGQVAAHGAPRRRRRRGMAQGLQDTEPLPWTRAWVVACGDERRAMDSVAMRSAPWAATESERTLPIGRWDIRMRRPRRSTPVQAMATGASAPTPPAWRRRPPRIDR